MPDVNTELLAKLQHLEKTVAVQKAMNDRKEQELKVLESRIRQGLEPNGSVQELERNLGRSKANFLVPGNVGDINKVQWGFWFSTPFIRVDPGVNFRTQFTVTQEAAFTFMSMTKAVYDFDDATNEITYIDPDEPALGESQGLSYLIRDAQSSREFFNIPQSMDMVGNPRWPTVLPTPYMFLPNSIVEFNIINNHPTNIYIAQISLFGYRLRIENSQNILSTVYG